MKKRWLTIALLSLFLTGQAQEKKGFAKPEKIDVTAWKVDEREMNRKIDSLLSVMTLQEKIGQTVLYSSGYTVTGPTLDENYTDYLKDGMVGAIFNAFTAEYTTELQKMAVENTRLGIPIMFGYDVIHGHRTIFPISLGESASWDLEMIKRGAEIAAAEAAAEGIHWTFAPMVDITRDPRWGRVSEGAGEDVYLANKIAKARVHGFQGNNLGNVNTVLACAKHYAAYGAAEAGRDYNTVDMSERNLREIYLPPFLASVEAGVGSFMTSFNEISGIPSSANSFLLDEILRDEWGFSGFVVTDYTSINEMVPHGYSKDEKQSAEQAMNAGVDMDMQGGVYLNHLEKLVDDGLVSEEKITIAARRILEMKYRLGLFQDPYKYSNQKRQDETTYKPEFLEAARDMARKSMVLLKNKDQILPLKKDQNIALIGPLVKDESNIIGSWAAQGDRSGKAVSVFEGFEEVLVNMKNISYAKGASIDTNDKSGFKEAIEIAKKADVVVMVIGEKENMTGEAASQVDINIPGVQKDLIAEIKKTGKPIVLVLMNGRPLTLSYENETADAILEIWFPGTMGGAAVADVLYGDYNPSGKLTMTFPRSVGQIPIYYNAKNTGRPKNDSEEPKYRSKYIDSPNTPLFPFGYGLSYTNFEYSNIKISNTNPEFDEDFNISVEVTNTGNFDGEEVVQLYVRDLFGSVTRPIKELKGFEKIFLKMGETKTVVFKLNSDSLRFYNSNMDFVAEPGKFEAFVGENSTADTLKVSFELK